MHGAKVNINLKHMMFVISGSHRGVYEICTILGFCGELNSIRRQPSIL
jgi:hypothetical protein